jgi:sortase A
MWVVNGTDHDSLKRGPGRDQRTYMPGQHELIYVAGHRTTYGAPFGRIDQMKAGDPITLVMPYGTFVYRVTGHTIVDANDLSVLESHGRETLALQACHPRFFATQRYIVWAKPVEVKPVNGSPYRPTASS